MHDPVGNVESPLALLYDELNLGTPSGGFPALLEKAVRPVGFRAGEVLVLEGGEVADGFFLIRRGAARLERVADGKTTAVSVLGPGDVAGEAHVLLGDAGTDSIVAIEPVQALAVSRSVVEQVASAPEAAPLLRALELRSKAARLRAATPLSRLDGPALREIAEGIEEERVEAGTALLSAGEEPRRMTFLRAGRAAVYACEGEARRVVADLFPGDSFGEAALLEGADGPSVTHAGLTVEAATDVELYHLSPETLDHLLAGYPEAGAAVEQQVAGLNVVAFLRGSGPFAGCDAATLGRLAAAMEARKYPAGADVVREGERGHAYYLVTRGRVCLDVDETERVKALEVLGPGDGFGEGALLGDGAYTFTATAAEETGVLVLDGEVFRAVIAGHGPVLGRVAETLRKRELPDRIERWSAVRQETAEGEVLYVIKDQDHGRYYRLSERGYFLWEQMDGNASVRDLVMAYMLRYKTFSVDQVCGLVEALEGAGFVRVQRVGRDLLPGETPSPLTRLGGLARRALYFTVPVKGFDPAVTAVYDSVGWVLYTRAALLLYASLAISGLGVSAYLFFADALPSWRPAEGWGFLAYYALVAGLILLHESAHALTVKSYGREVRRAGFGFVFATPFLYVDTSDMWMDTRRPRIVVSWAGPYLHLILGGIAAWALLLFPELRDGGFAVTLLVINYLFVVANLFPLLEFDGYYMLMDYLEIPRLRNKAVAFVGRQFLRPTSPLGWSRVERIFAGFGLVSGAYTIFVILQLLLFANFFVGYYAALVVGSVAGSAIGWTVGVALTLLLLWPSVSAPVRGWRRKTAASV